MAQVRRSSRTRQQATSIYDEAKKEIEEKVADLGQDQDSETDSQGDALDEIMNDVETGAEADDEEASDEESSDEEEEDFQPSAPRKPSPAEKKKKAQKKTQIKVGRDPKPKKAKATGGTTTRGAQSSLTALAKKVLYESENPNNSLVAALLNSYKGTAPSKSRRASDEDGSIYTPQLERIARRVIEEYKNDPNRAQVLLLNLLFRSVGGNVDTNLDPNNTSLEDLDNEEWAKVVTELVDVMRHTAADRILVCADPKGAAHAQAVASGKELDTSEPGAASFGIREYRKIYEEFWYLLGTVALTEGIASNDDDVESDEESDDDENQGKSKSFATTSRFDAEVVRELISRMTELVTVGQPDVRAAATVAALELGHAVLNQTALLAKKLEVATRQYESAASGKKDGPLSKKAQSFKHQVDSLKRTKDDLEEIVTTSIIQGVFMHRYRDSSMYIRATALKSLSRMTLQRPDLFLADKYLKYFGWMISDKDASVRVASLQGLQAPFTAVQRGRKSRKNRIDLQTSMSNVITKFLPKLADCVLDVNSVVQEHAMALLLTLEREAFLDEIMNDNLWTQINIQALSTETTPAVRRDSLYFVMDQLEAFDEEESAEKKSSKKSGRSKDASLAQSSERMMVQRLDALACWVGDALSDGPVPIDKIRFQLADYIVESLREMPEHKALVTNWNAMLRAIGEDSAATTGDADADRVEVAKQRVLVQMLARAAQAEVVAVAEPGFLSKGLDPDEAGVEAEENAITTTKTKKAKGKKSGSTGMPHEVLSVALLNSLPDLLIKFKVDPTILGSLTTLPRYILPSVFSLTQRKKDFTALVKNLCDIYLESSDEYVLQNIALSLTSLSEGGHTRSAEVNLQLQRLASTLSGRAIELLTASDEAMEDADTKKRKSPKKSSKRKRASSKSRSEDSDASDDESEDEDSEPNDSEYAISSCLRRLRILSKRCNLSEVLDESASDDETVAGTISDLCDAVVTGMEKRLKERAIKLDSLNEGDDDDEGNVEIPEIWKSGNQSIHDVVACSVRESLSLLLSITSWKLLMTQKEGESMMLENSEDILMEPEEGDETDRYGVVRHRDQLFALLVLCFEQFLPSFGDPFEEESMYSKEHVAFSDQAQSHACSIAGDLRSLFLKDWAEVAHPVLRACALTNDQNIAGGLVRFVRSKEVELRIAQETEAIDPSPEMLLPIIRSIAANWMYGNRREAGVVLAHVTGSGAEAGKMVSSFSRVLKKINPIRLLEAHMACLRQSYQEWVNDEPEDPEEGETGPTDEAMDEFEQAEKKHVEQFHLLEQQASRLSQSLGVGKLSDPKLSESILGFVRNGIKFAFDHNDDDEFELGARLNFLSIMSKYATWIKKDDEHRHTVRLDLEEAEETLKEHPDYNEVPEEDKALIESFRSALGIKKHASPRSVTDDESRNGMAEDYSDDGDSVTKASINTGGSRRRRRRSGGASVASVRSKLSSAPGSLSPLYEEDASVEQDSNDDEGSEPHPKRRRGNRGISIASTLSVSTMGHSQPPIAEGNSESGSETDDGGY